MKILVTGASGFVGETLCNELISRGHSVRAAVRRAGSAPEGTEEFLTGNISQSVVWGDALEGQDAVVHLAARVHVMTETSSDPLEDFRAVNTAGTLALGRAVQDLGIQKFVFLSSIKVNGEGTIARSFQVDDEPHPHGPYAISKYEAEEGLRHLSSDGHTAFLVVRTPLIYGPTAGGNFLRLLRLVSRGIPIPLAGVRNQRTMISIWNLTDLIVYLLEVAHPRTQLILAGDKDALSTAELLRAIGKGLRKPARLVWSPVAFLELVARILGRGPAVKRLVGSLEVEIGSTSSDFSWAPQSNAVEGVERAAREWGTAQSLVGT